MLITEQVAAFIRRERLLSPGQPVVVAVSGGPDSLCLLDCLQRLEYPILVAHLDHRLRAGSWREAEFVLREARRRGLPAIVERVRPPGVRQPGHSIEESSRIARYRFLVGAASEWGAGVVAVGHTADDQVETILMHFLRGAGVHGLRGMLPKTSIEDWEELRQADGAAARIALRRASSRFVALRRASHPEGGIPKGASRRGHSEGDPEGGTLEGIARRRASHPAGDPAGDPAREPGDRTPDGRVLRRATHRVSSRHAPRRGHPEGDPGEGRPKGVNLIRPLLEATRVQTEAHCRAAGLRPRRDPSNQDPTFFRNRLRHRLLPVLANYNPGIRDVITRTGAVMRREAEMLDEMLDEAEPVVLTRNHGDAIRLNRTAWLGLPAPVQAGLLWRAVIALVPAQRDLGFQAIELARARIKDRSMGRRTPLPGGVEMVEQGDFVLFLLEGSEPEYPGYPQLAVVAELQLPLPGKILLQAGGALVADILSTPPASWSGSESLGLDPVAWLDAAKLSAFLLVRPARLGDRMRPLGMQGHRKLGDIFNSLHIPSAARRRWPVVVSGEAIVWLTGLRISDDARVTPSTRQTIRLLLELPGGIALRRASPRASHPAEDPAGEPDGGIPEGTQP